MPVIRFAGICAQCLPTLGLHPTGRFGWGSLFQKRWNAGASNHFLLLHFTSPPRL